MTYNKKIELLNHGHVYFQKEWTGPKFYSKKDLQHFLLAQYPGNIWAVTNNKHGNDWIRGVQGVSKTKAEAQTIVDAEVSAGQAVWDGWSDEEKAHRCNNPKRPGNITLP